MGSIGKSFSVLIIVLLAASSLIMAKPAFAQTSAPIPIPTPSVPEFTLKLVGPSYIVNTTYSLDQHTGKIVAQIGYTNEYSSIEVTVKNQPFTPYTSNDYGNIVSLMYNVRIKPHNEDNWVEVYNPDNGYPIQSNSDYTIISISIEGEMDSPLTAIAGTRSDIQVEALIGYVHRVVIGFGAPWVFNGTESGWSNTQTLSIPANISLSPTLTPSSSTSTQTPIPTANSSLLLITTLALVVVAFLLAIIIFLLLYKRKRRTT
jgi:hypothetical protein